MKTRENYINDDSFIIPEGLQIDLEEGFRKVCNRQFGGTPGRGFGELIQNFLDSYDVIVPWKQRKGIIEHGFNWILLQDFGSGLDLDKIRLILTLGGTDKANDKNRIGKFGIGFFSIFDTKLKTRMVQIITRCEGQPIKLVFLVDADGKLPVIHYEMLDYTIDFSTEVKVTFDRPESVQECLQYARKSLEYYPCDVTINGEKCHSIWDNLNFSGVYEFDKKWSNGYIYPGRRYGGVTLLCKYERLAELSVAGLVTGGHGMNYDLRDYSRKKTPYLPGLDIVLNCNNLTLTISRDSWYLDYNFNNMIDDLNAALLEFFHKEFPALDDRYKLANLYVLRESIKKHLNELAKNNKEYVAGTPVYDQLTESKLFRVNGRKGMFSVNELMSMKSADLPLFYSEEKTNLRWLGGKFKHDFIVIPESNMVENRTPDFFDSLFGHLFGDVVNLDKISGNKSKIRNLLERGIIEKDSLEPVCEFIKPRDLSKREHLFLRKMERLLNSKNILQEIEKNLHLEIKHINPVYFSLENRGMYVSTGLFNQMQKPIGDDYISNLVKSRADENPEIALERRVNIYLGLCLNHPFINKLIHSNDPQSEYYALTYIAHELTSCQKILSPYSSFYNMVKSKLSSGLRKAMIGEIVDGDRPFDSAQGPGFGK